MNTRQRSFLDELLHYLLAQIRQTLQLDAVVESFGMSLATLIHPRPSTLAHLPTPTCSRVTNLTT